MLLVKAGENGMGRNLMELGLAATLLCAAPSQAQVPTPTPPASDIVVTGTRDAPSRWREAETSHVVVLSDGAEAELVRITRNLERLHFLLSLLTGRGFAADDALKLRVTLIGDPTAFTTMQLGNRRWQQGPFAPPFMIWRYYDPREDGAVMAATRIDQKVVVDRGTPAADLQQIIRDVAPPQAPGSPPDPTAGTIGGALPIGLAGSGDLASATPGERAFLQPAEHGLYAGFAQHFLLTYSPAAYPRWYLDGFGQVFSTLVVQGDGALEYGRAPQGAAPILDRYGAYPLDRVLDGRYLREGHSRWTPVHAWLLTHYLFFSEERRPQLRRFLAATGAGTPPVEAAKAAFGDLGVLTRELRTYHGAKKPYERVSYPADRNEEPVLRRLSQGQAAFVQGRLELGSRVELPPEPAAAIAPEVAEPMRRARAAAVTARDRWLAGLRRDAARYPADADAQLLLAEAECRSGNAGPCAAAADRALARRAGDARSLAWRGEALAMAAASAPVAERAGQLTAARRAIAAANRADTEAVLPLLAYHRSFTRVGETAPAVAIDGLAKALAQVPAAPATRLALGTEYAARDATAEAQRILQPVARGGYDTPERPQAAAVLARAEGR
jgi:hypothetical protein